MRDAEVKILEIETALSELKNGYRYFPGRVMKSLALIRDNLDWIERRFRPTGISETSLSLVRDRIFFLDGGVSKSSHAIYLQNIVQRPNDFIIIGIDIVFSKSQEGNYPGLNIRGTMKDPIEIFASELPKVTSTHLESPPQKIIKLLTENEITREELGEKIEEFSLIDLGVVELHNLGLAAEDKGVMNPEHCEELIENALEKIKTKESNANTPGNACHSSSISPKVANKMHVPSSGNNGPFNNRVGYYSGYEGDYDDWD